MNYCFISILTAVWLLSPLTTHAAHEVYVEPGTYNISVKRWSDTISNATFDSDTWIWNLEKKDRLHKNGNRDTLLSIPRSSTPEDITLVVWFHGLGGFSKKGFIKRILPQMEHVVANESSFAIAVPEMPWSTNTSTPRKRQGRVWTKQGELERYVASVKQRMQEWAVLRHGRPLGTVRIIFVGHSAGGSALMSASVEGGLCKLKPEAIIWSDASYGYWLDRSVNTCIKDTNTQLHILVRKWDKPHRNAGRAIKRIKRLGLKFIPDVRYQVLERRRWTHSKIGNSVFMLTDVFPPGC